MTALATRGVTDADVRDALSVVLDPELDEPITDLGFVRSVEVADDLTAGLELAESMATEGDGVLVAAAPAYLKTNSHGEFVFDHAWANAYARYGHDYFPKWLCAVPYSPVTGPRLLARTTEDRQALLRQLQTMTVEDGLSSAHVNFHTGAEAADFDADWLARIGRRGMADPGHGVEGEGDVTDGGAVAHGFPQQALAAKCLAATRCRKRLGAQTLVGAQ